MTPDLTDAEIDMICDGLVQNHAKIRYLERMGITVRRKPNGRPLVNRTHYDATMGCSQPAKSTQANGPVWGVH